MACNGYKYLGDNPKRQVLRTLRYLAESWGTESWGIMCDLTLAGMVRCPLHGVGLATSDLLESWLATPPMRFLV
jgi:hypothetical protein